MKWICKTFDELTTHELYELLKLRAEVFVVEQECAYQDLDDKDKASLHMCGFLNDTLVAYTRIVPKGVSYPDAPSIGRVVTKKNVRMTGVGIALMNRTLSEMKVRGMSNLIHISAQCYLEAFYRKFRFEPQGENYLEDGIPHVKMTRKE